MYYIQYWIGYDVIVKQINKRIFVFIPMTKDSQIIFHTFTAQEKKKKQSQGFNSWIDK